MRSCSCSCCRAGAPAESRARAEQYDGDLDIPATSTSDTTFSPGEKGTGSLTAATVEGWTGFDVSRVQTYSSPDQAPSAPSQVTQLVLTRGNAQLGVFVSILSGPRDDKAASQLARQLATEYISRLG